MQEETKKTIFIVIGSILGVGAFISMLIFGLNSISNRTAQKTQELIAQKSFEETRSKTLEETRLINPEETRPTNLENNISLTNIAIPAGYRVTGMTISDSYHMYFIMDNGKSQKIFNDERQILYNFEQSEK
jgi:hypothetical protein